MRIVGRLARTTAGPLLTRAVVFLSAAIGLWIAMPSQVASWRVVLPIVLTALLPALLPAGRAVGFTMVMIIVAWLTSTLAFGDQAGIMRTFGAACALYLVHTSAALAALLPHDAIVDSQVLVRWAARSGMVVAVAGLITSFVVVLAPRLTPTTSALAVIAGLAIVTAVTTLLSGSIGSQRR